MNNEAVDSSDAFEKAINGSNHEKYVLRLYVSGNSPKSTRAVSNIREICEEYLQGRYEFEVIDISQQTALARQEQIIATPTLIKLTPRPKKIMVGDFSQTARLLAGLGLAEV